MPGPWIALNIARIGKLRLKKGHAQHYFSLAIRMPQLDCQQQSMQSVFAAQFGRGRFPLFRLFLLSTFFDFISEKNPGVARRHGAVCHVTDHARKGGEFSSPQSKPRERIRLSRYVFSRVFFLFFLFFNLTFFSRKQSGKLFFYYSRRPQKRKLCFQTEDAFKNFFKDGSDYV